MAGDFKAGTGLWDFAQVFQHQTVEGFGAVEWKAKTQLAVEFAQQAAPFDQMAAVGLRMKTARLQRRVRGEFPD